MVACHSGVWEESHPAQTVVRNVQNCVVAEEAG